MKPGWPQRVAVIVGLLLFVATGFLYLTSGLVVPMPWLGILWAIWLVGMWASARLTARWSWWIFAAAPAALLFWFAYVSLGEVLFGWRP